MCEKHEQQHDETEDLHGIDARLADGLRAHGGGQIRSVKEGEHSCHVFFGDESRNGGQSHLPLRDSHRIEEIHECAAGNGEHTLSAFRADIAEGKTEREQRPACHEKGQHHRGDFYYKLFEGK